MQFSIAAAFSLVASVQALKSVTIKKLSVEEASASNYTWTVTNWAASCLSANSSCSYSFNISAPEQSSNAPAFSASCAGTGVGSPYQRCNVPQEDSSQTNILQLVSARLDATNGTDSDAHLVVSYQIDNSTAETEWNYTSYSTQPFDDSSVSTFTLAPSEVWAAA